MFKTTISDTPFTSDIASSYFSNITGDPILGDVSFLATLRALLAPRIKAEDTIRLVYTTSRYSKSEINGASVNQCVDAITSDMRLTRDGSQGLFVVHNFRSDQESNLANMKAIEAGFTDRYSGYSRLEKMTAFFKKSFPVLCYVNPERRNVVMFVESLDIKKMHYLQMSVLPALPWYFNPEVGISEDEMALIQSLRETTSTKYLECLEKLAKQYDFRTTRIRQMLAGFETRYEQRECEQVKGNIQNTDNEIERYNNQIGVLIRKRNDLCIRLLGLEQKIAEGCEDSDIMDYFLCNSKLYLEEVNDSDMYFSVKDYVSYFDKDAVERVLNNKTSYIYCNDHGNPYTSIDPERMVKLIKAVFIDETLKIKFCAAYRFSLNGSVSAMGDHSFPASEFSECMPNPHINQYRCMGGYQQIINDLLRQNDYIGALEQCIASCKSLNFCDSAVMRAFMRQMYGSSGTNSRCIELPDGSVVKPLAAIKWLEEQEAAANGTKEEEAHE